LNKEARKWRIAITEGGLATRTFFVLKIPPVTLCTYKDHSVVSENSDGSDGEHGFINAEIFWENMSPYAYFVLKRYHDDARASAGRLIYMTLDPGDGRFPGPGFIDISGRPHKLTASQTAPAARSGAGSVDNVRFFINDITEINVPSSYS
jgi:hypothetical protein